MSSDVPGGVSELHRSPIIMKFKEAILAVLMVVTPVCAFAEKIEPRAIRMVPPVTPEGVIKPGERETVVVELVVEIDGTVSEAKAIKPKRRELGEAAVASILQWKFAPGIVDGKPVRVKMKQPITFSINPESSSQKK